MEAVYKFGWFPKEEGRYAYPDILAFEQTSGPERLVVGPSANHIAILIDLLRLMSEPLAILYVLVVPRGGSEAGRDQTVDTVSRDRVKSS